jgi:hypothetical protein
MTPHGRQMFYKHYAGRGLLQDLTFTSCAVAFFNCLVLFLSNPLLMAYPSICLAGAPDQCKELATSYTLIPRCDSTNRKTAG